MMKRILIVLLFTFILAPFAAFSTHIVGGTLTYVYNGGSSYTVTLKLFRDCSPSSAAFPGSVTINVAGYNGATFAPSKDFTMNMGTVTNIPPVLDPCAIPPTPMPCVQQAIYTTTVTNLPPNPGGYHLYYQIVARNLSLSNINAVCNCIGESFYAYIPGETVNWFENYTGLANGTTTDAGATAWTIAPGVPPPSGAAVQTNVFEIMGANNASETWTSQVVNISACTSTNIRVDLSESGTFEPNDSILVYYRLNGGPLIPFTTNGFIADDFTNAVASVSGLSGTTVQVVIRAHYDAVSTATELYRFDNVSISCNNFLPNNNPEFTLFPPLFLCVGQPFTFDHSATDANGDSLYYSFYTPYNGDNGVGPLDPTYAANTAIFTPIVWQPGYSATNPLGGPALNLNPNTGLLTGTPTMIGQFVVGIKVTEYRNGNYMSQTLRDFQFNIVNCPPPPVTIAGNDIIINDGCVGQFNAVGYNTPTVTWTSIAPGAPGAFNSFLSCTSGCLNPTVASTGTPPAFVDYVICGISSTCNPTMVCDTVRVTFNPTLNVTIAPLNPTICFGQTSTNITATGTGGTPPYSYLWNGINPSPTISVGPGNYTVVLTDASGCPPATASVTVTAFSVPISANAGANDTVCAQSPNVILNGTVAGASGGIWSGAAGTFSPSNTTLSGVVYTPTPAEVAAGTLNLTLTTTGNGTCPGASDVVTLTFLNFTGTPVVTPVSVSCFGGTNGTATVTVPGGIPPYTYLWNTVPVQTTVTASNLAPGTYTVTITNGIGCSTTATTTITQPTAISLNNIVTNNDCSGGATGSIAITPVGGTPGYTYLWAPGGQTTSSITGQVAGTYTVTVTDTRGCTITNSYTITQPATLSVSFTQTNVSCFGGTNGTATAIAAGGTPAYTYSWTPSGGTAPTASGLSNGTYTVTLTDSRGCTTTGSVAITQPVALTTTTSHTNEVCFFNNDGTATAIPAGGTPGYTYLWNPGAGTTSTITGLSNGTYTLTVTDANGCSASAFAIVTQPPALIAGHSGLVHVRCFGASNGSVNATAVGGTPGYTYLWAPGGQTTAAITGLPAGSYTVTVTDSRGCTSQDISVINQPPLLTVSMSSTPLTCFGAANGTATATPSGGTPGYVYTWMPGALTGSTQTGLVAGTYTVTVRDSKLCSVTTTVLVTQPASINLTTSVVNSTCSTANGQASVTATGGVPPFTYLWSPTGGTGSTATGLLAGAYTVVVTDANGCTATQWANINDASGPTATIFSITNVSCFGGNDGSASVGVVGGLGPYTYTWLPAGGSAPVATGLTAGTYTVTVLDANGCLSNATTSPNITEPPPLAIVVTTSDVSCFGDNNGTAIASASGGTPGYSYLWLPSSTSGSSISTLTAGTFTVQVTDTNSCVQTSIFTIAQPAALTATISSFNNVDCFGGTTGSATVTAAGGSTVYNYNWLPSGGTGPSATGLIAGTYTVTVTDDNNCTTTASIVITEPAAALTAVGTGSTISCFGGSNGTASILTTGGTPAYNYLWLPSGGTASTASGLAAGTYFIFISDANGCSTNESIIINNVPPLITTLASVQPSCGLSNGSVTAMVTGGTGTYTYLWSPGGATTSSITTLTPGTYNVVVTDANSCTASASALLTNIASPIVSILSTTNVSCFGGNNGSANSVVSLGTPPYVFSWSPFGGSTSTGTLLPAGSYTVTVTDDIGCTSTAVALIIEPLPLGISVTSLTNVLCDGNSDGTITVSGTGGSPAYSYNWSPIVSTLPSVTGLGIGSYTVNVNDLNGCSTSISIPITQPAVLTSAIGGSTNPTCFAGTNGTAFVSVAGGTIPYSYLWSNGQTGSTAINLAAGFYSVTVTDFNGCTSSNTVLITQPTQVITSAGPNDTICLGSSGTLTASASGGAGSYYFAWQPPFVINSGTLVVSPTTNTNYVVIAYDLLGCAGTPDTISTVVYNLTAANLDAVTLVSPICPGQSTTVSAIVTGITGPITYLWNNGLGTSPGPITVSPTVSTTYIVSVTNSCGTTVMDSVQVIISPPPTVIISSDSTVVCVPSVVQFYDNSVSGNPADPIHNWFWTFGDGSTSTLINPTHVYTTPGSYMVTLTVTTGNGCTNSTTAPLIINAYPFPIAAFSINSSVLSLPYDPLICTNMSIGAATYSWNFGDGIGTSTATNPTYTYTTVGSYPIELIATNIYGCSDTAYSAVETNTDIVFPNVFTPNEDGSSGGSYDITSLTNDVFFPYASGVEDFKLQIYDRWGELIFESTDVKQGWDGYYRGKICQQDVYIWKAEIRLNNGTRFNKTGDVTLLR